MMADNEIYQGLFYKNRFDLGSFSLYNIPSYIQREYPLFTKLLEHFYKFLSREDKGKILWALDHLYEHHNVISPLNQFWDEIYADGGFPFNKDLRIDQRAFFNYLMDFYMYRGSVKGLKFLISVLYDEDCKVSYPREQLLIPSQAHYSNNQYMCVKLNKLEPALHKKITDALNNYSLIIQSVASGFTLDVESVHYHLFNGSTYLFLKVKYLFTNKFVPSEQMRLKDNDGLLNELVVNCPLIKFKIKEKGHGFSIGDSIGVKGGINQGSVMVKSVTTGGINDIEIVNAGRGYKVGDYVFTESNPERTGGGFYAEVTEVDPNGAILKIEVRSKGRGFSKLPRVDVATRTGKDAQVKAKSKEIGGVQSLDYFYNYAMDTLEQAQRDLRFWVKTKGGEDISINYELVVINDTNNVYFDYAGFLSNTSYLTDSLYYQQFSYKIDASIPRYIYDKAVDIMSHPVGYIRYAQFNLAGYEVDYEKELRSAFYKYKYKSKNDKKPDVDSDGQDSLKPTPPDTTKPNIRPNKDEDRDDQNKVGKWSIKETLRNRLFLVPELRKVLGNKYKNIVYWQSQNHLLDTFIYLQKDSYTVDVFPQDLDIDEIKYVFNEKRQQTVTVLNAYVDNTGKVKKLNFREKQAIVLDEIYKAYGLDENGELKEIGKVVFKENEYKEEWLDSKDRKKNLILANGEGRLQLITTHAPTPEETAKLDEMFGKGLWFSTIG